MINEKLETLILMLTAKTKNKQAIWNRGSGDNQFKLILPSNVSVTISYYEGDMNNFDSYIIAIYNDTGDVIQRYSTDNDTSPDHLNLLKSFHQAASDVYFKVDETFEALLKTVTSEGVIGTVEKKSEKKAKNDTDELPF